jgi:2-iminobutanoate/2-iminopropanoate deaminase
MEYKRRPGGTIMEKQEIICDSIAKSANPLSQGIRFGNLIFLSGQLGRNPGTGKLETGVYNQTFRILENLKSLLETEGLTMRDVLKTTIFMVDISKIAEMNKAYGEFFVAPFPTRSCIEVSALGGGAEVEIEVIAGK